MPPGIVGVVNLLEVLDGRAQTRGVGAVLQPQECQYGALDVLPKLQHSIPVLCRILAEHEDVFKKQLREHNQ
ncbi:hypothetical protein F441_16016 [Phytophthora nicotianae CJ01A1]|uniref:Uncharacterized protein n=3 Tax=Phytophthora nicotianae TaxID=4792 RepID=W2PTF4_PHYN3|nr:hypothetical protein PPTG_23790 [Phytophthora nicotianae INRA-310]ETL31612.1 hypothetical protein L916_15635 [Phytophthora nicotianae]ETN03509.1 hypothetical protein PPTG_23790 [Phytophthora nicotianae INRA-310]ETP07859.1 hypothetical protein F441_16016 [Phytophthora nicotianae CJ01A1]